MSKYDFQNGFALGLASGGIIESGDNSRLNALEGRIDESEVLDNAERTLTQKVDALIEYADLFSHIAELSFEGDQVLERIDVYIDGHFTNLANCFKDCINLKYLAGINTSKAITVANLLANTSVEEVAAPFDFSSVNYEASAEAFTNANMLREVRVVPNTMKWGNAITSPYLSDDSLQSILAGLSDITKGTGVTRQVLTFHPDVYSRITEEEKTIANNKGWSIFEK